MGFCKAVSAAMTGTQVEFVQVEADVNNGLPGIQLVGYLSSEVKEASERVRTAIRNTGVIIPPKKIIVNLSPACMKKRGTAFDLPIAAAILGALGMVPGEQVKDILMVGELGLDGKLLPVNGILPVVSEAYEKGIRTCIVAKENAREGALVEEMCVMGAENLEQVQLWLREKRGLLPEKAGIEKRRVHLCKESDIDYSDICGQEGVKRATLVAVAGGHNLLYIGPPGSGKTMMAKRIPTILPPLGWEESMEITKIYSMAGLIEKENPLIENRPFREVHHNATKAALTGGGRIPRPGEITLAHRGVLFLDELPEFAKGVLEVLRQPLEEKKIHLVRQSGTYEFPADCILAAAMNPCMCGNYPDLNKCTCTSGQIQHYLGKVSQPFLDRIDICVEAPKVEYEELRSPEPGTSSKEMRELVLKAQNMQQKRWRGTPIKNNAQMGNEQIKEYCSLSEEGNRLMRQAFDALGLTARTYYKILKVARTIADMDEKESIELEHLKEAVGYRVMDKKYWGY